MPANSAIGIIESDRLLNIPRRFRADHEFCFHLRDLMTTLLVEAEAAEADHVSIRFANENEAQKFEAASNVLDFLLRNGYRDAAQSICFNQLSMAIFGDMLHFVYEALIAMEKRKFSVAIALLRKPLKENLVFAAWLCADEDDFFERFLDSPARHMEAKDIQKAKRIEILKGAIEHFDVKSFADADRLNAILFDKEVDGGLAVLFDKATHLVTSRGTYMRTEGLNLNFIFKDPLDNDLYEGPYPQLAYVLLFALSIQIALFSRMARVEESFRTWALMTAVGAYSGLFVKGRSSLVNSFNGLLKEFLACPHCKSQVKIEKSRSARFFIAQMLRCQTCNIDFEFPLSWVLSQTEWNFFEGEQPEVLS